MNSKTALSFLILIEQNTELSGTINSSCRSSLFQLKPRHLTYNIVPWVVPAQNILQTSICHSPSAVSPDTSSYIVITSSNDPGTPSAAVHVLCTYKYGIW